MVDLTSTGKILAAGDDLEHREDHPHRSQIIRAMCSEIRRMQYTMALWSDAAHEYERAFETFAKESDHERDALRERIRGLELDFIAFENEANIENDWLRERIRDLEKERDLQGDPQ